MFPVCSAGRQYLLFRPEEPAGGENQLDAGNHPQRRLHLVRGLGDPSTADGAHQRQDKRDEPAVALVVLGPREQRRVGHQVAQHAGDDDGGDLADLEAATGDNLASGLEAQQGNNDELLEVDGAGHAMRGLRAVHDATLDDGGGQHDEDGLAEERQTQDTAALAPEGFREARKAQRADYKESDRA